MIITYYNSTVPGPSAPQFKKLITAFEITFLKTMRIRGLLFQFIIPCGTTKNSKKMDPRDFQIDPKLIPTA